MRNAATLAEDIKLWIAERDRLKAIKPPPPGSDGSTDWHEWGMNQNLLSLYIDQVRDGMKLLAHLDAEEALATKYGIVGL